MNTSVKSRVDAVRTKAVNTFGLALPLAKARDAFSRILYGKPYSAAVAAEKAGAPVDFEPTRSRAAAAARHYGVEFGRLWGAIATSFNLYRTSDTWSFGDLVNVVASDASYFSIVLEPTDLNDAIAKACYARPYKSVIDAEAARTLEPLRLPPRFLKDASDHYGIDVAQFRLAFNEAEMTFGYDRREGQPAPPSSAMDPVSFAWCRERSAAGELNQLSSIEAFYFALALGEGGMLSEAEAVANAAHGLRTEGDFLDGLAEALPERNARWADLKMKAFALGRPLALVDVAEELFDQGHFRKALDTAASAASKGSRSAAALAGYIYQSGAGVAVDGLEAARWYSYAATLEDEGLIRNGPDICATDGVWDNYDLIQELSDNLTVADRKQLLKIMADWSGNLPRQLRLD